MQDSGGMVERRTGAGVVSGLILCFWVLCSNEEGEGGEGGIKSNTELARSCHLTSILLLEGRIIAP